ncbi:YiiX/YebB-like N1pC/P60 family cysteine hydrolase [Agarivorans sp. QJM3NY_33]|uniref:YiiX/YebB-like N1pC/P60 family cysteine hydrolase n=1 Tax=Agarivorans sp. QJM3NY_33 TaxID=3421432 RepID=UPI003D7EDB2F
MYLLNRERLKQGDIILTCSDKKPSKTIRTLTRSAYSHVILYVGESSYIHSDPEGVHSGNLQRMILEQPEYVQVVRVNDPQPIKKAIEFARLQVGSSYSRLSAVNAGAKFFSKLETKKQFCSRLVAKSYEYAGLALVANSDTCLPQDLADSQRVSVIKDCIYQASKEEIDFALSFNPINKQTEITNDILKSVRKIMGNKIQSLADITSRLIKEPHFDQQVTEIYACSGYLDMWRYEKERNAWRYNANSFMELRLTKQEIIRRAYKELEVAESLLALYKNNLEQYFYIKEQYKLKYAEQQFNLYRQLVENALNHKMTAEAVIKKSFSTPRSENFVATTQAFLLS